MVKGRKAPPKKTRIFHAIHIASHRPFDGVKIWPQSKYWNKFFDIFKRNLELDMWFRMASKPIFNCTNNHHQNNVSRDTYSNRVCNLWSIFDKCNTNDHMWFYAHCVQSQWLALHKGHFLSEVFYSTDIWKYKQTMSPGWMIKRYQPMIIWSEFIFLRIAFL